MNLIRNTLLVVAILQLLGFLYIKFIHQEKRQTPNLNRTSSSLTIDQKQIKDITKVIITHHIKSKQKKLPISTEYTDNLKQVSLKKSSIIARPKKIVSKKTKIVKTSKSIHKTYRKINNVSTIIPQEKTTKISKV